jgi:hypothetical protein
MIEIKDHLYIGIENLRNADKNRFIEFVRSLETTNNIFNDFTKSKIQKINLPGSDFYIYKLSLKLRVLIKLETDKIIVQDILTHDRLEKYFKNFLVRGGN